MLWQDYSELHECILKHDFPNNLFANINNFIETLYFIKKSTILFMTLMFKKP